MNGVKKTVPKWRNAYIARARARRHFEFKLRVRLLRVGIQLHGLFIGGVFETVFE